MTIGDNSRVAVLADLAVSLGAYLELVARQDVARRKLAEVTKATNAAHDALGLVYAGVRGAGLAAG